MNQPSRSISRLHDAYRDDIGDLVTRRPVPGPGVEQVDPFLFLNHHGPQVYGANNRGLPFGPHPHRGFETVTFVLEGSLAHKDTGGHESVIDAGGVQWMTAGSGLIHAELSPEKFLREGGPMEILQLWVNLPAKLKMTEPRYTGLQREEIPVMHPAPGVEMQLISGALDGQAGPVESLTDVFMTTIEMQKGAYVTLSAPSDRNVFFYVVRGQVKAGDQPVSAFNLAEFAHDGDVIDVTADENTVLLFGHGEVIDEPMVAHGPFVMNTVEEINEAIRDYRAGKFNRQPINL